MADTESQPAVAGDSVKPGVERSGTPGRWLQKMIAAHGVGDSVYHILRAVARYRGLRAAHYAVPGVPLRSTPGFTLSPATAG